MRFFAQRMVDAHLAADRTVHLREEGRRHLRQGQAAQERRRGKAGRVPQHATAHRDDACPAVGAVLHECVVHPRHRLQVLAAFAIGHEHDGHVAERCQRRLAMKLPDTRRRHDDAAAGEAGGIEQRAKLRKVAGADVDRIRARGKVDCNAFGWGHRRTSDGNESGW